MRHKFVLILIMCFSINDIANAWGLKSLLSTNKTTSKIAGTVSARDRFIIDDPRDINSSLSLNRTSGTNKLIIQSNHGGADMEIPKISIFSDKGNLILHTVEQESKATNVSIINKAAGNRYVNKSDFVTMNGKSQHDDTRFHIVWDRKSGELLEYNLKGPHDKGVDLLYVEQTFDNQTKIILPNSAAVNYSKLEDTYPKKNDDFWFAHREDTTKNIIILNQPSNSNLKLMNLNHRIHSDNRSDLVLEYRNKDTGEITEVVLSYKYKKPNTKPHDNNPTLPESTSAGGVS